MEQGDLHGFEVGASLPAEKTKYKKAPDAPKRFKSSFIIFSSHKHKEIRNKLKEEGRPEKTPDIAKLISEAWKNLSTQEKEEWEAKADKDKERFDAEKAIYTGPWRIPANMRIRKDPRAPKRPMSAFLAYSNSRRAALKRENPGLSNADLSRMLSKSWKNAKPELKEKYYGEERKLREKYKIETAKWRKNAAKKKQEEREEREAIAFRAADYRQKNRISGNEISSDVSTAQQQTLAEATKPPAFPLQIDTAPTPILQMNNPYQHAAATTSLNNVGLPFGSGVIGGLNFASNPYIGNPFVSVPQMWAQPAIPSVLNGQPLPIQNRTPQPLPIQNRTPQPLPIQNRTPQLSLDLHTPNLGSILNEMQHTSGRIGHVGVDNISDLPGLQFLGGESNGQDQTRRNT